VLEVPAVHGRVVFVLKLQAPGGLVQFTLQGAPVAEQADDVGTAQPVLVFSLAVEHAEADHLVEVPLELLVAQHWT
jgi:hypothetical protein